MTAIKPSDPLTRHHRAGLSQEVSPVPRVHGSRLLCALLLFFAMPTLSSQSLVCGDCNLDGTRDIVDALRAAQINVGVHVPSPLQLVQCDVLAEDGINILDALIIGQFAAGLSVLPSCPSGLGSGAAPIALSIVGQGIGGSGLPGSGEISLDIVLADAESDVVDLIVEFRTPGRAFEPATLRQPGSPWQSLSTTPAGVVHTVHWRSSFDLPEGVGKIWLRATPFDPGVGISAQDEVALDNLSLVSTSRGIWLQPSVGDAGAIATMMSSFDHRANVLPDSRIIITGGQNQTSPLPLARAAIYDPTRHLMSQVANMPGGGRVGHLTHVIDRPGSPHHGWLIVAGGFDGAIYRSDVLLFDPATLTWTNTGIALTVNIAGSLLEGAYAGGKGNPSPSAYVGANGTLTTGPLAVMVTPPAGISEPQQTNVGYRIVIDWNGDGDFTDSTVAPVFYAYVREIDEDFTVTHHPGQDGVRSTLDDRLLVFGGVGIRVNPSTGDLSPPMNAPPGESVPPGCILADLEVVDLDNGVTALVDSTRLYDDYEYITNAISAVPGSGDWEHRSTMARYNHDAAVLDDGRVLICGGMNAFADFSDAAGSVALTPNYDLAVQLGVLEPLTARSFYLKPDPLGGGALDAWIFEMAPRPANVLRNASNPALAGHMNYVSAITLGSSVLMAGGDDARTSGSAATSGFQSFDPSSGLWDFTPDPGGMGTATMLRERALHSLSTLVGGVVIAIGGSPAAGFSSAVPSCEFYLP